MIEKKFTVIDKMGLHARPVSLLVNAANKYKSDVLLVCKGKEVNMKSIMMVMSLGIAQGDEFSVIVKGDDEVDAIESINEVITKEKLAQ